ncbi:hypothetical protein G6F70_009631 [Rhizopus microsporus]|nr:hypothetical protein G6F71_009401 [Rhizopus microsporus]KAG1185328.1 hypothetical protein G6F70_009631 [Rhizopus microsporus]KAG1223695.1 hypothetical protein G6F67_009611 [Rhizopus microsporus]
MVTKFVQKVTVNHKNLHKTCRVQDTKKGISGTELSFSASLELQYDNTIKNPKGLPWIPGQRMTSARLELATACVLDRRDNHLHQEVLCDIESMLVIFGGKLFLSVGT